MENEVGDCGEETGIDEDDDIALIDSLFAEYELEGKGTEDAGAASETDDDDSRSMPEHVRDAISLAENGTDDPDGFDQGRSSV